MADYYTKFSAIVENLTPDEAAWLHEQLDMNEDERFESDSWPEWVRERNEFDIWPQFEFEFEDDDTQLWVYSRESDNIDQVAVLIQEFLSRYRPNEAWGMQWSNDCSKPRTDAYGGGAIFVTADKIEYQSSFEWLWQKESEFNKEKVSDNL